jgi:hypothetical protein
VKAVCRFVPVGCHRVKIFSDHAGLVFAARAGWGRAPTYNNMLQRLDALHPTTKFEVAFVAGLLNPADAYSRGHGLVRVGLGPAMG